MSAPNTPAFSYKPISATGNVMALPGILGGFFISATTALTITIYDDAATGTTRPVLATATLPVGWYKLPVGLTAGCYVVLGGVGTVTLAVLAT